MEINLTRDFDAKRLNAIVNDPAVYPDVHGTIDGPLDFSMIAKNHNNYVLMGEHGGLIFHQHQPGLFEVHTQVLPAGRGKWALYMAKEALRWMFERTSCLEVITRVPQGNVAATALTKAVGMNSVTVLPNGWATSDGVIPATVYNLTLQDWLKRDFSMAERGSWLQRRWQNNEVEDTQALGLTYNMMLYGQSRKAAIFLKRWLAIAGKTVNVEWISDEPARLRVGENFIVVRGEKNFIAF